MMTEEQRARWKKTRFFTVEQWNACADAATPLVCPMPTIDELRSLSASVPEHIQASGWYIGKAFAGHHMMELDIKYSVANAQSQSETSRELVITNWAPAELGRPAGRR